MVLAVLVMEWKRQNAMSELVLSRVIQVPGASGVLGALAVRLVTQEQRKGPELVVALGVLVKQRRTDNAIVDLVQNGVNGVLGALAV